MSLPSGFLDELRTRISISQVVGRKVVWDARKSNQGKGDMWAPCPFHQEKSASFHVDDRKGFYYCFGCHAKGDALTFIRETENVGFMEAVEILAREAGMPMPAPDPQARQKADRRSQLAEVMERAVRYYRRQLAGSAGADARDYLARRGLSEAAQERFSIGYAPMSRQSLIAHMAEAGVPGDLVIDAGLAARGDNDDAPYDRFRGRIIFPIRDAQGACIALGGRAMDPNARAKYLNSPETELFDKGRGLYNIGPARVAAGKGATLVVAEGYMDVIALSEAGFGAAVAPLGTAITEDQLRLMWRIAPEPVITLDGDAAGIKAALRLIDLALPLLEAGKSLRFCILPRNMDPDDVIRTQGKGAMQKLLDQAEPMVNLLWRRETEGRVFDSPERKAALERALNAAVARIADPILKKQYDQTLRDMRWQAFRPQRPARPQRGATKAGGFGRAAPPPLPSLPATRASLLGAGGDWVGDRLHEAVILAVLITHPALIREFLGSLETLYPQDAGHRAICDVLLAHHEAAPDRAALTEKLRLRAGEALEKLLALSHVRIAPPVRNADDLGLARLCLAEEFARLAAERGVRREVAEAEEDMQGLVDEGVTWRLSQAAEARYKAGQAPMEDANDLGEDRQALSRTLQNLIDKEVWVKKKG
ncbi:MAG: DNA primase [Rhodobacteraceae bacterium]|nr:DNA primase [Paracoccaceae bacterium]